MIDAPNPHVQLSLLDAVPSGPVVRILTGPPVRPRSWRIDYPGGRTCVVERTPDPAVVRVTELSDGFTRTASAWDYPAPSTLQPTE